MSAIRELLGRLNATEITEEMSRLTSARAKIDKELRLLRKLQRLLGTGGRRTSKPVDDSGEELSEQKQQLVNRIWDHLAEAGTGTNGSIAKAVGVHHKTVASVMRHPYFCSEKGHYRLAKSNE